MKRILLITAIFTLAGCEQQYRYPCQDPTNWEKEECQKPICEVNKDCPEYIFKDEKVPNKPAARPAPAPVKKGECK